MRRRLLILAVFLLVGAVVNVAVAWGCALGVNPYGRPAAKEFRAESNRTVFKLSQSGSPNWARRLSRVCATAL